MSDIFTLNSGDATAIQQHYEQIIETLLRTLLDVKNSGDNQRQDLKIFDGDRLVYGRDNNQFRDEISGISGQLLNPQLISELQQLRSAPVGNVVEGANNKRVESLKYPNERPHCINMATALHQDRFIFDV